MRPLEPIGPAPRAALGILFFVLFVAAWSVATFGGFVSRTFLADPLTMLSDGWELLTRFHFAEDIGVTIWRVVGGFVLAAAVAVPVGVLMGTWKPIEALLEPFVSFARYLPASAFVPLLILWAGIGEAQKLSVIFIGSVFQLVLMVAVSVGNTRRDLVEAAYTLGASDLGVVRRVLIPATAPEIAESLRLVLGWAWTYVIVAEFIGSSAGIGHMIIESQALLATGQIIFGIIVIGLIGLLSDFGFKAANPRLLPVAVRLSQLVIEDVSRDFGAVQALQPTRLSIAKNDFVSVLGPSGCGKSTLLRIVGGLDRPTTGRVLLDGRPVTGPGPDRGMVFQSYTLFPWLTVADNIAFGLRERRVPTRERDATVAAFIDKVGLRGFEAHYPKQLSGGMQQRTAIARALANDPAILLLDEPFGALDHQTRGLMQELLLGIWERERKTVVFVTHDIEEAVFMASRVVVMTARPGRIKADVAIDLPHPRHYTLKTSPQFSRLKAQLTEEIRGESMLVAERA